MSFIEIKKKKGVAILTISRGKVNAFNDEVVKQIQNAFNSLENDTETQAVILTGNGKFYTFGFDIPKFLSYSKEEFTNYLICFTDLYMNIFLYPKPVIAALNGHSIAGGCMLALACDSRIMVSGKAKISLNEIAFGSSVFAGCVEMLRFFVGSKNATMILYSGKMYSAEEAKMLGLVDNVTNEDDLMSDAMKTALELGSKLEDAFVSIKALLRKPIAEAIRRKEKESIKEFVNIWYSKSTWENLKNIKIH
jgi:enoyl-CoA hydratase/carnithine racemase